MCLSNKSSVYVASEACNSNTITCPNSTGKLEVLTVSQLFGPNFEKKMVFHQRPHLKIVAAFNYFSPLIFQNI